MVANLVLCLLAFTIFLIYNIVAIHKFGVPSSLSNTYYLYNGIKKNLGYVFTAMMFFMGMTLLPAWLSLGETISDWSIYLQPLSFFAAGSICFVGAAPAFRSCKMESTVHSVAAKLAAACSLLWCFIACWQIMYVPIIAVGVVCAICFGIPSTRERFKKTQVYWLEMMAFVATFATVITECIIQLCK